MYINQQNKPHEIITEEQVKLIKKGYAYRRWKRIKLVTVLVFLLWIFVGMDVLDRLPESNIKFLIDLIYCLVGLIIIIIFVANFRIRCWKCPNCKKPLPKKNTGTGVYSSVKPIFVMECEYCNYNLTQRK